MGHSTWRIPCGCYRRWNRTSNHFNIFAVIIARWLDAIGIYNFILDIDSGPIAEWYFIGNEMWTNFREYSSSYIWNLFVFVLSTNKFIWTRISSADLYQRMYGFVMASSAADSHLHFIFNWPNNRSCFRRAFRFFPFGSIWTSAFVPRVNPFVFSTRKSNMVTTHRIFFTHISMTLYNKISFS